MFSHSERARGRHVLARPGQGQNDGQGGVDGEEGRKDGLLEGGEAGSRESFVGEGSGDEGLEDA